MNCAYRELGLDERIEAGDWWAFKPTGPDDRMTFLSPNWFDHDELGKCFRVDAKGAEWLNSLGPSKLGPALDTVLFREDFEDF